MKIIAITGTIGAGKGTIVEFLKEIGYEHYSVRGFLSEILKERNLEENRDNMRVVANELRKIYGAGYIVETLLHRATVNGNNAVVESIRTTGEVKILRQKNAILWGVDANQKIRYNRIFKRGTSTDKVTFKKFLEQEKLESESESDDQQNLRKCIDASHKVFLNEGTIQDLKEEVMSVLLSKNQS